MITVSGCVTYHGLATCYFFLLIPAARLRDLWHICTWVACLSLHARHVQNYYVGNSCLTWRKFICTVYSVLSVPRDKKFIGVLGWDSNPRPPAYQCRCLNQLNHRACQWQVADFNSIQQRVPQQYIFFCSACHHKLYQFTQLLSGVFAKRQLLFCIIL